MNRTRVLRTAAALTSAAAFTASMTTVLSAAPAAAGAAPTTTSADLVASKVVPAQTTVMQGRSFDVTHAVANRGRSRAGASETRFYLSTDAKESLRQRASSRTDPRSSYVDLVLTGARKVAALAPGRSAAQPRTRVVVPIGTPPGGYALLACADDRGAVRERNEAGNCAVASKRIQVTAVPGSETLRLEQFADAFRWPADEAGTLQGMTVFCQATYPVRPMTLAAALASARSSLGARAGADAVRLLDSAPLARTADQAQELAAAAVVEASPGLALAALLRAHSLEPRNASHLVNAAAMATALALPNEALAFLDAVAGRDLPRPAMGVSQQATALVVRANALVLTGRSAQARPLYDAALVREPLLSEAQTGLATIAACQDDDETAARWLRKGRQRTQRPDATTPTGPRAAVDTSRGRATPLRRLPLAESPQQLVRMRPVYQGIADGFVAEIGASNAEDDLLSQRIRAADQDRTRAEIRRRDGILRLGHKAGEAADIEALQATYFERIDDAMDITEEFFGEGTGEGTWTYAELLVQRREPCVGVEPSAAYLACLDYEMNRICRPATISAHQRWLSAMSQAQQAGDAYQSAISLRISGYAANLADADAHRSAILGVEELERAIYGSLVQQAGFWSTHVNRVKDECVEPKDAPALAGPDAPAGATPGPCSAGLKAFDIVIPLGAATVKVNCEKIQVGVSSEEVLPLLVAFAEVTYDFRAGKVTFFGGAQGGGKVGDVVELAFKSGIYVTADKTGTVDAGWRVGPSAAVGVGSVESGIFNDEIDISFVNALKGTD